MRTRLRSAWRTLVTRNGSPLASDAHVTAPRYGYGLPPHPRLHSLIESGRERYRERLRRIVGQTDALARIPVTRGPRPEDALEPAWDNNFLPGLDAASLYCFIADASPRRYIEVGSGNSTMFVRRAIRDNKLTTSITSIDPFPRADIDAICDRVVREPLGRADLGELLQAEAGDVIFLDGSHQVFTGSDVTVAFLDVLPELRPGVIVQIHDIWLPYDYPSRWGNRLYSEQYMLAVALLSAPHRYRVLLPNMFIASDPDLRAVLDPLWSRSQLAGVPRHGGSFWIEIGS